MNLSLALGLGLLLLGAAKQPSRPTFAELPQDVRQRINLRLARSSDEIPSSPFATLTSFEVHGAADDAAVIETARRLGVKHFVMHNIHGHLRDPSDERLTRWCELCDRAGIEVRAILHSTDLDLWKAAFANWGKRIRYWSYLNEPNSPIKGDHTNPRWKPDQYVRELRAVRELRDRLAPQVKLGGPEVAMLQVMEEKPFPWLRLAIEAGLLGQIDFFTFHPYRQGYSPRNPPENPSRFWRWGQPPPWHTYEEQIRELRRRVGDKPLVINEVGWSTTPRGPICEHTQAKFALRQQILDFSLGIRVAVYFLLRERYVGRPFPVWHQENYVGIVHTDNSPKPAYTALQALYSQIDDNCKPRSGVPVRFDVTRPSPNAEGSQVKWYLYEDRSEAMPVRKLLFWYPVAATDDFQPALADVRIGEVVCRDVRITDSPCELRLHNIGGRWGWPVLMDFLRYEINEKVQWAPAVAEKEG
ncbi:MAG: hypothetical protein J7M26_01035 [Armatimonadetes bacterium]|nr:hypothetical protein [Armatimonadota bacterium]